MSSGCCRLAIPRCLILSIRTDSAFPNQSWCWVWLVISRGDIIVERSKFDEKMEDAEEQRLATNPERRRDGSSHATLNAKMTMDSLRSVLDMLSFHV